MQQPVLKASQLRARMMTLEVLVALPATAMTILYAISVLALSSEEWRAVAGLTAAYALLIALLAEPLRRHELRPLLTCLELRERGEMTHDQLREGFRTVMSTPLVMQRTQLLAWVAAAAFIPVGMLLMGNDGWSSGFRLVALVPIAVTGGLVSSTIVYFVAKQALLDLRSTLAREFDDPDERRSLVIPLSISRKISMVIAGSGMALVVLVVSFAHARSRDGVMELASQWQMQTLEVLVDEMDAAAAAETVVAPSLDDWLPVTGTLPFGAEFRMIRADARGSVGPMIEQVLDRVRDGEKSGVLPRSDPDNLLAWQSLSTGGVIVSQIPKEELAVGAGSGFFSLSVIFGLSLAVLLGLSQLLSRDISQGAGILTSEAERMAQGDLRRGRVFESEDELGALARSFESMGGGLRSTVSRVADAADRVDGAASDMAAVSESVATATVDQVRRIQQAGQIMGQINTQVTSISQSAQALNSSVEESSSSILELGAAGDELNDTASVLSTKVEETTHSIEQMVASVKQVRATSESLSDVAADTSSSMEEMASAMRAVDTTAELTATLSREVVESAETGQARVSQTIDGMRAISDATLTAEQVIRGLGARTKEIGAILDVIDDVADETNLLALNAAIIAAQAGEQGRAFSVVADEIKELADRVLASTKEIGGLIRSVQDESSNAIAAIEDGSRSVASGVDLSAEAGTSLEEITRASRESGERIGQIVSAVREQTKAATFVVSLMDRVKNGVEQINLAGSEQDRGNEVVYRSSVTMREVAQQVRRTTEEQSRGFGRIRESVEGVRGAVEQINGSLQEQSAACHQVADFLEQVSDGTRSNEGAVQRLGESIRSLVLQAEVLREDVAKFRV